jgi:hypothetical protein
VFVSVGLPFWGEGMSIIRHRHSSNKLIVSMNAIFTVYMLLHGITQFICIYKASVNSGYSLWIVAQTTTVVLLLKRSYTCPPLSLSLVYFLFRTSSCPTLRNLYFHDSERLVLVACIVLLCSKVCGIDSIQSEFPGPLLRKLLYT